MKTLLVFVWIGFYFYLREDLLPVQDQFFYHSVLCVQHYGQIHVAFKQRLLHAHLFHEGALHYGPYLSVIAQQNNLKNKTSETITFICKDAYVFHS